MHYNPPWQGEIVPTSDPQGRLCQFDTMVDGIRAGAKNLLAYFNHDGCKTISQIITRYAPSIENPTANYIDFVAKDCGVDPDDEINLNDANLLRIVVSAIIRFEQGFNGISYNMLCQGIEEALGQSPPAADA